LALDDYVVIGLLASSAFFVAVAVALLYRYRQASSKMVASTDLGRDLWQALEQRMKKQDERILDMMGRMEVLQSRMTAVAESTNQQKVSAAQPPRAPHPTEMGPQGIESAQIPQQTSEAPLLRAATQPQVFTETSRTSQSKSQPGELDDSERQAVGMLSSRAMNTRELTDAMGLSREHTARIMKRLFDWGLVVRNDSSKPFVYELTDSGRKYLR